MEKCWFDKSFKMVKLYVVFMFWVILSSKVECKISVNVDGGYEDVVVEIEKQVPQIQCQQLIQNIQGIFRSASEYLFGGTEGRLYFHRVIIVVPPTWDSLACGGGGPLTSYTSRSAISGAAFRVGGEDPLFGDVPWTHQSRGCRLQGDFISVPYAAILQYNATNNPIGTSSVGRDFGTTGSPSLNVQIERLFVKEWAKYRYGVFDEIGFPNDPIYPTSYSELLGERKPTSCTNRPLTGNWSPGCDEDEMKNGTCNFIPSGSPHNDDLTSSIMSFPTLRNVALFCDQNSHNSKAPTKQNFLCQRNSVSEVIQTNPDFRNLVHRETRTSVPAPEFLIKQITSPRFVLLVEETGNMNLRDVWKFLKLGVRKFIKYDLPTGTEIGLISVSTADVKILSNMTSLQTLTLRRALADKLPNYPNVDSGGNISLRRGIVQAVQMLKMNGGRAAGSVIILVSQGTVSTPDLEASLELLNREDVTLASIEYPSLGDGKIGLLAEGTDGPAFSIRETGVGPTTHMSTYVHLINALMSIQRFFTQDVSSTWPVLIHEAEYKGDSRFYVEGNFSLESSVSQAPAEFFIYTSNPNDPKINSVELTSPSGLKYTTQLSDLHDINVIKIDALINEGGVWKYRIDRLADSHQSHFVQVLTKTSSEDLNVRLYSNLVEERVANLTAAPLILYVQVRKGRSSPIVGADVEAEIVAGSKKFTLRLLDNGNGDADITGGDGVYSRYFILPPGVSASQLDISARVIVNPYRARFVVASQPKPNSSSQTGRPSNSSPHAVCCGSSVSPADPKSQYKILPFGERRTNVLKVRISSVPPKGFYTPGRIGDLRLDGVDSPTTGRNVTLKWTAPGEELDEGVPASYQFFYSVLRSTSGNENWLVLSELKADLEAGVEDNATVTLPYYGSFMVALRAVNFHLKPGKMSNIIQVTLTQPPKEPDSVSLSSSSGGSTLSIKNTTPSPVGEFSKFDLLLIVICGVAFVLLLAGLIVILLYCRRVGSSQRKSVGSGDTKISAITDPKSPIHWSASELLGEHEKGQRQSIYGGSVGSKSDHQNIMMSPDLQKLSQNQMNHHHHQVPPNGHLPMHLNILPSEYEGTNSSTRSRNSPDSYDDPDSPTPIPVSVRHTPRPPSNYAISVDTSARNLPNSYGYPQQQFGCPHQPHYQVPSNGGLPAYPSSNSSRYNSSPLPPPPLPPNMPNGHSMHYDPDHGSMNSVNSKKRNITMV